MTAYYVNSAAGGANTGGTWTDAFLTLLQASAVATATDTIYVDDGHSESQTTAMALVFPVTLGLRILSVDSAAGLTPSAVSAGAIVAIGAGSVGMTINGCAYIYGVTFRGGTNASANCSISLGNGVSQPPVMTLDTCALVMRTTSAANLVLLASGSASADEGRLTFINTTITFSATTQTIQTGTGVIDGIGVTTTGSAPDDLFETRAGTVCNLTMTGCNFSATAYTNLISSLASTIGGTYRFIQCKLPVAGTASVFAQALPGGPEIFIHDCATNDTHGIFGYANAQGGIVTDSTIKFTGGAAGQSWKITTTALVSLGMPFCTPWIDWYNTGTSAITPRIEVVRTGSATALNNDDLWIEVDAKVTSGSTQATRTTDRRGLLAANAAQDTGAGTWDGSPGTPWYGKLEVASLTPAENGHIRARVCVAAASVAGTYYVDPQIRT